MPSNEMKHFEVRFVWSNGDENVLATFVVCPNDGKIVDGVVECTVKQFVEYKSQGGKKGVVISKLPQAIRQQVQRLLGTSVYIQHGVRLGAIQYIESP